MTTQTHAIAGHTVEILEAPRFNRNRPARYTAYVTDMQDARTYPTPEAALEGARQALGDAPTAITCARCNRPATITASRGPACDYHYDGLSD